HILDHALHLFIDQGYGETTMRDIAAAANCSLGLTYRYFARKEDLVLALYRRLAQEQEAYVLALPPAPLADRFVQVLQAKLAQLDPYRSAIGALFGAALTPQSGIAVLGDETSDIRVRMERMFLAMIAGATDAPRERQARQLATVLYTLELALVLFWVHDRSPNHRATTDLLKLAHDGIALVRPVLRFPPIAKGLARLAQALGPVFGAGA
ncbi:MAG TPA: TetR/AcrR family transcriptional regulator, partial [Gammaproteobacteria bacterium]|nr:TetR/AcrR family transcriptional regulator [Gammaproteobacteria bacterium]